MTFYTLNSAQELVPNKNYTNLMTPRAHRAPKIVNKKTQRH